MYERVHYGAKGERGKKIIGFGRYSISSRYRRRIIVALDDDMTRYNVRRREEEVGNENVNYLRIVGFR